MTEPTLTVPIGCNASLDGGPFPDFSGLGIEENEPGSGVLVGRDQEGNREEVSVGFIEESVSDEMRASEPVSVSTGDTDGMPGPDGEVGEIEVPLVRGFHVETHGFPHKDNYAELDNLRDDDLRRRNFERRLKRHGGTISG